MSTPAQQLFPDDDLALVGLKINDRYRIKEFLGKGGMGVVYLADHLPLNKQVAIKVLSDSWASDERSIQRFEREAQSAGKVVHPHIIPVYDLGRLEDGRPYFSMEYCKGASLSQILSIETKLTLGRTIKVVSEAAAGLDAVHAHGIIHRDIKPENFFISWTKAHGEQVKLLDFGLAAFISPEEHMEKLTRKGQMHGTPHYMSPEMANEDPVGHRADIYSLAVVAFELLTGALPFDSDNPFTILHRKCKEDPPSLASKSGFPFPLQLEHVLGKGLARKQENRYPTAGDFARDFQRAIVEHANEFPREMWDELMEQKLSGSFEGKNPSELREKPHHARPRLEIVTPKSSLDRTHEDRDQEEYKSIPISLREQMNTPYASDEQASRSQIKDVSKNAWTANLKTKKGFVVGIGIGALALTIFYFLWL